ncbi:glycoside hydrolase family 47 protein, partial [Trichoderma asperelloides]
MFAGRPRFIRNGIILAFFLFVIWRFQFTSPSPSTSEWKLLQHRMNHGASPSQYPESKSSFDWGAVKLRFAPNSTTKLPKKSSRPLPRIQHPFGPEPSPARREREARLLDVKKVALRAWRGYKKHAWMQDALLPISGAGREQFSGWAATLVDSLDTLWIMGLREEFDEAVAAVADIDFGSSTSNRINIFETNIRYLGGLLAAYDLSGRELLLKKAVELGDLIYGGFNTENGMPVDFISFHAAKEGGGLLVEGAVVSASPGTLSLELAHLSQVTGDMKYYSAVAQLMDVFYQGQNQTSLPGVWPMNINMNTKDVVQGSSFTLGGCADSLYEYLPKMHQLLGGGEPKYDIMSRTFLKAADRHFLFRPMLPDEDDILISGNVNINSDGKPVLDPETEHLACFVGGMFGLAGRLFSNEDDVERGIKLTKGCVYAYRAFPTGMMPERIDFAPCKDRAHCPWDEEYWIQERDKRNEWKEHLPKGFTTAKDPRYLLRPEAIESVFYAYRFTGRKEFQDAAWDMFTAIAKATKTEYANAAVLDVTTRAEKPPQEDYMEV